jgi:uncharacterized protein (TIGR03437 family)
MVGNQGFVINEAGVGCTVTVTQQSVSAPASGGSGLLDVSAPSGCSWTATPGASWISLMPTSGTGPLSVSYAIAANTTAQVRSSNITISNVVIPVSQDAANCNQSLSPAQATVPASAGTYSFTVNGSCSYMATSNNGWIAIHSGAQGVGGGTVSYGVSANTSPSVRTGSISVGSQSFGVQQSGASCTLALNPAAVNVAAGGGSGTFAVNASGACAWQPAANVGWIHLTFAAVNGSGTVTYTIDATNQSAARAGVVAIGDRTFQVVQAGRPALQFTASGVVNGASFATGPVSPGEIISIFGTGIGPNPGASFQIAPDGGPIGTSLGGVEVLFDGTPAPLIYVSGLQISAIVPYEVGAPSSNVVIEYQGFTSNTVSLPVVASAPAVFTLDTSGSGQGAILNQDGSVNSASNPAAQGSIVVLFATGEGQTKPAGVDGKLAVAPLPKPVLPVSVQVDGLNATVTYAGGAPGLTAGVLQVNVQLPGGVGSGAVPVVLQVGNNISPSTVTVALQ